MSEKPKFNAAKSIISVHMWTEHFLGTEERAKSFLALIRSLDDGRWVPERWSQFEPIRGKFSTEADEAIVEKWTEWRHSRISNCLLFKRTKPKLLLNVTIWKGRVPDLNYVWFDMDSSEFSGSDGTERLKQIVRRLIEWSGAVYATASHLKQHHQRSAPGNPRQRLDQLNWLSFFGAPYLDLFGGERIRGCPFHSCEPYDGGLLVLAAERWDSLAMTESSKTLIGLENCLGSDVFANDECPTNTCRVPIFNTTETIITS